MFANLHEWTHLLIRMAHFLAGIMWIGTSLYFVWMDSSFEPLKTPVKGKDGELWMVHGGNFYHVEKRKFGPGEMPLNLHWFKWEATLTWVTGFFMLWVVYYSTDGAYLVDPSVMPLKPWQATLIGIASLPLGWLFYDLLFRSKFAASKLVTILGLLCSGVLFYFLTHVFSGRGAFIHVGAIFGTMMILNVWVHILPNQRAIIKASLAGLEPNYDLGVIAKRRSIHNSYMTLPVLFIMISNHFPGTFGHKQNWIILILIVLMGALVRHTMISAKRWPLVPAGASLLLLMWMTQPMIRTDLGGNLVPFTQVRGVLSSRCISCHSETPTDDVFKVAPLGVVFDRTEHIQQWAPRIRERAAILKTMPLANKTQITEEERDLLDRWVLQGANVN